MGVWLVAVLGSSGTSWAGPTLSSCSFTSDDAPADTLDCEQGGAWAVSCPLPSVRAGKAQVHLSAPTRQVVAESPVSLRAAQAPDVVARIGGPANRAGTFVVASPMAGMLPGQAVGPLQLCPVVQPDVTPGDPRGRVPLTVSVSIHAHEGFSEQVGPAGVVVRSPKYGPGQVFATATIDVIQRPVAAAPVMASAAAVPRPDLFDGLLQLAGEDGAWRSVGWTGAIMTVDGPARVTRFDFVAPVVEAALGGDAIAALEADLTRWLAGEETLLSRVAWARSDLPVPTSLTFSHGSRSGHRWRVAGDRDQGVELRLVRAGDRARVVIARGVIGPDTLAAATADL